jgi:sec-independent protein translocase protein TatA
MVQSVPLGRDRRNEATAEVTDVNRIGLTELLIIVAIFVVIFGGNRLPELGRSIGRGIRSFKESLREGANDQS